MCAVSVIYDIFKPMPDSWYNQERINLFKRMISEARTFDIEANQPDCEDPDKAKLREHIFDLEYKLIGDEDEYKGADHE